jgi:hypothetical protein
MDDIRIDEGLVRSLLREQHPDLAGLEIREVAGGWDRRAGEFDPRRVSGNARR